MVYFLWDRDRVRIKVGKGCRLALRMAEQGVGYGSKVLLGVMDGERKAEFYLHEYFQCIGARWGNSDWFDPTPRIIQFVNRFVHPVTVFDWYRDASTDESPFAAITYCVIAPRSIEQWADRLMKHAGLQKSEGFFLAAIKAYAKSVGFEEPMPEFPKPKRRHALVKLLRGRWWIYDYTQSTCIPGDLKDEPSETDPAEVETGAE